MLFRLHPCQLFGKIRVKTVAGFSCGGSHEEFQHAGIILHTLGTFHLHGGVDVFQGFLFLACQVFEPGLRTLPHNGCFGFTFAYHFLTELLHLSRLLLVDVADKELTAQSSFGLGIFSFLSIVYKVLQQEWQHLGIGVLLVLLTDGLERAFLRVEFYSMGRAGKT